MLRVDASVKVIGDIYGQYFDLIGMLNERPPFNYLFLGNYIGHGNYSLETILFLFCLKVRNPDRVSLLRGNQETYHMSKERGFFQEVYTKYGNTEAWREIVRVFDYLPLCAVIGDTYLAVHGDASEYNSLDCIREISRHREDLSKSTLFWAKISYTNETKPSVGYTRSLEDVSRFLAKNKLKVMIRGNGVYTDGYQKDPNQTCISLCSCPFFLHKYDNLGAIMVINEDLQYSFQTFQRTM